MIETANPSMAQAAGKIKEGAAELSGAAYASANEKLKQACSQTKEVIKENPYTSIAVAFGVGAILGALLSRR